MRKTIALACILKNEVTNLPQLLESVKDCFDEIHLTDTGSTDGSLELIRDWIEKKNNPSNSNLFLHDFKWVDDFSAARNYSFSHVKTDYVMWMDLDDVLSSTEKFISWRDSVMQMADFWLATYHYASDHTGKPFCSFARERVVKTSLNLKWKYFVHEGICPTSPVSTLYVMPWQVVHKRTEEDLKKDRSRNLSLFENRINELDPRMRYYYGKELFENQNPLEAIFQLEKAILEKQGIEPHDRVMGHQYAAFCAMQLNQFQKAISLATTGLMLDPKRAEFFVIIADCYLKLGKIDESIPYYKAAGSCPFSGDNQIHGAIFSDRNSYFHYPRNQLARVYANKMDIPAAEKMVKEALEIGENEESRGILKDLEKAKEMAGLTLVVNKTQSDDVLISCLPGGFYEWDEEIYKTSGIGGSETACVEMAYWIAKLTGREVKVFNNRKSPKIFDKVQYLPAESLPKYCAQTIPKVNIAWRHNIKLTSAPTYLWCHDLCTPGMENQSVYDKLIVLSRSHSSFAQGMVGVDKSRIWISRNGVNPERFISLQREKQPGKIIFSSSPDRGLDRCISVMDKVVKELPQAELHCFYGFDNMLKMGKHAEVAKIKALIEARPYVKYHGNISQHQLTKEMASSQVWLYPTDFQETFCITALEAAACGTYPVVRSIGALPETLAPYQSDVLDLDCSNSEEAGVYAQHVLDAIRHEKWSRIECDLSAISWQSVAQEWIEKMNLL